MKMIVKLTVLLTTLMLLTGVASAAVDGVCSCYEVVITDLDGPPDTWTEFVEICFDENNVGHTDLCGETALYMFFDSMREQALTYHSNFGVCVAYLKFHGDNQHVVTGIVFGEGRATFRGHKIDNMSNCEE